MSSNRTPSLAEVIADAIESRLVDVHVGIPATVVSFDASTMSIQAQIVVKDRVVQDDDSIAPTPPPILNNVAVIYPGGNGFRMQWDLAPGDTVELIFQHRSIDKWLSQGGEVDPLDDRLCHLADAVAIPGLNPFNASWQAHSSGSPSIGVQGGPMATFSGTTINLDPDEGASESVARMNDAVSVSIPEGTTFALTIGGTPTTGTLSTPVTCSGTIVGPCAPRVKA